jgi:hypothetical protein
VFFGFTLEKGFAILPLNKKETYKSRNRKTGGSEGTTMAHSRTDYPNQSVEDLLKDPMMGELFKRDRTSGDEVKTTWLAAMQGRDAVARNSSAHAR